MSLIHLGLEVTGLCCLALASAYAVLAVVGTIVWRWRKPPTPGSRQLPPVTLLKPLCGAEPGLYVNLRSFCLQDYPRYQIVFGVRDATDPALAVVERIRAEFPRIPIDVVISAQQHGGNRKVSNLINMLAVARHDVLAIADSDAFVGRDYLAVVTAPLLDREVGLVTCLYHSVPTERVWSRLGAMYVNQWYMPSVLLARFLGETGYASGQTLCMRRDTLEAIGGLSRLANHLADDYELGESVRRIGQRIVLSRYVVEAEHHEPSLTALINHETRWMRTIRVLRPGSFRLLFISFTLPLACLGLGLTAVDPSLPGIAAGLFWICVFSRLILYRLPPLVRGGQGFRDLWLLPVRDLLVCWVWARALRTSRISWRGGDFEVDEHGLLRSPP